MGGWIRRGKIELRETVYEGLDSAPDAFIGLFQGAGTGKMPVKLQSPKSLCAVLQDAAVPQAGEIADKGCCSFRRACGDKGGFG